MSPLLRRTALRFHLRHPWQAVLAVLGVALGVAVVLSIDLAIQSASRAFRVSAETVAGRATHHVLGGPGGVPEEAYAALRLEAGLRRSAPLVEAYVSTPRLPGRALRLLGVDPFAEGPLRPWLAGGRGGLDVSLLLTGEGAAFVSAATARDAGLAAGDTVRVEVGGGSGPWSWRGSWSRPTPSAAGPSGTWWWWT